MNDINLRHRAFQATGLGEALNDIADLTEEQQLELLKIAVQEGEALYNAQFIAYHGLEYARDGREEDIHLAFDSGFIPPDEIRRLKEDEERAIEKKRAKKLARKNGSISRGTFDTRATPTSPEAKRIAALYRRRETTAWSAKEIRCFRNLKIEPEDLDIVERYYRSESQKEKNYCRRDLYTFLNNFRGEVDRARSWVEKREQRESFL